MKGIIGKKVGMTQVFGENGEMIPVTVISAPSMSSSGKCIVVPHSTRA